MEPTTAVEIQEEIQLRIHELNHTDDDHVAGDAARILFELAHFSNPYSESNKRQIAASGGVGALCKHLRSQSYEVRYQTCSALGELAFRNEENCVLVVNTSDALPALAEMLACSTGNNQEDAALVINNCASFCEETAEQIVRCPGMLASLKLLAVGRHVGAKNVSIGALNCLSRSPAVLAQLVEAKVVDEALVPVLEERGRGEKLEVRKARAMMAVVNLTGALPPLPLAAAPRAPLQQRQHHGDHHQQQHLAQLPAHHRQQQQAAAGGRGADLAAIVRVLGFALDGKKWVGVSFTPYSVLYPLSRLAVGRENRAGLVESGVVELLVRLVEEWEAKGRKTQQALLLALEILEQLAEDCTQPPGPGAKQELAGGGGGHRKVMERLRSRGTLSALHRVASQARGEAAAAAAAGRRVLGRVGEGPVAFWMGQHSRLGEKSPVLLLDEFVAGLVLDYAFLAEEELATRGS